MFGFLRGPKSCGYRRVYARCCSMQRSLCGFRSLPVISYESVFAYCLAIDAGLIDPPRSTDPTCCRARHESRFEWHDREKQVAEFCVQFAMLLVETKLQDDIQDSRKLSSAGLLARTSNRFLHRNFVRSRKYFHDIDDTFRSDIEQCLLDHAALEKSSANPELGHYVQPTARAFARAFGLLPKVLSIDNSAVISRLEQIGANVGAAIIAYDCAVDWHRDKRNGEYNPLGGRQDVGLAFGYCQRNLVSAGWNVAKSFGQSTLTASILHHQVQRVASRRDAMAGVQAMANPKRIAMAREGVVDLECLSCLCDSSVCIHCCDVSADAKKTDSTQVDSAKARRKRRKKLIKRSRSGFCDCDCGGCDCGGCDSCGCDGCDVLKCHSDWVWCDPCCLAYGDSCNDGKSDKNTSNSEHQPTNVENTGPDPLIGSKATTVTLLAPFGTIQIDSQEHPAKSEGQPIEASTEVIVVRREAFGYVVREASV